MWRNTGLVPKLFFIDYTALAPMMLWGLRMSERNFTIAIIFVCFLTFLKIWHITPMGFLRMVRCKLIGQFRTTKTDYITIRRRTRW
ncbi:MAG: hypothetical protein GY710_26475 [Desulfobacteraceae bacterium]|nr:hypothetical protein [Desulfobacteraceae bacterium]